MVYSVKRAFRFAGHLGLMLAASVVWQSEAHAQSTPPLLNVVIACGSPNSTYPVGRNMPATQDQNGNGCLSGTFTGTVVSAPATPAAGTAAAIATGGTAVTIVTAPVNGGYITNPPNAASQKIGAAENAYCDPVATPGSTDATGNGTTSILIPGQTYTFGPLKTGVVIKCNAATSLHALTVVTW